MENYGYFQNLSEFGRRLVLEEVFTSHSPENAKIRFSTIIQNFIHKPLKIKDGHFCFRNTLWKVPIPPRTAQKKSNFNGQETAAWILQQ
jgi:hypothetical protein